MSYEEMSDFDINLRVACAIDGVPIGEDGKPKFAIDCFLSVNNSNAVKWTPSFDDDEPTYFNPCNNPSDAWPTILDNEISLVVVDDELWVARAGSIYSESANPLRAAMIVFLMMQEESQ